jgi:ABC-type bacteriocin/lantibiotic exporter with double-glycine peptidase domain
MKSKNPARHTEFEMSVASTKVLYRPDCESSAQPVTYPEAPSLGLILFKLHYKEIIGGILLKFCCDILLASGPVLVSLLVLFTEDKSQSTQLGIFLVACLFLAFFFENFFFHQQQDIHSTVGIRIRSALINLIYKKSLRLSTESRRSAAIGEIVNLMQVNTQVFFDLMANLQLLTGIPAQLTFSILLMWYYLGTATAAAIGTIVALVPALFVVSVFLEKYEGRKLQHKDARLKLISEVLNGIKVLKLYGWEVSFINLINKIRNTELAALRKFALTYGVASFSWAFSSFIIQVTTFITYLYIDNGANILRPNIAFVSLSLFNMIRTPLYSSSIITSLAVQVGAIDG